MSHHRVVLPFRAEFGIMVRYHVPVVRALPRPVTVCHEPGLEALYPDCRRIIVTPRPDRDRRWTMGHDDDFVSKWRKRIAHEYPDAEVLAISKASGRPEQRFLPEPFKSQRLGGRRAPRPDVVICPRWREYAVGKNWSEWGTLTDLLAGESLRIFGAGQRDTSDWRALDGHEVAWDYRRPLDATIEAMRAARLVLATDAGLAHLAVLCGVPLLMVAANGGLVAPGPTKDETGKVQHPKYWTIRLEEYYQAANHQQVPIEVVPDGWHDVHAVVNAAIEMLSEGRMTA